jgi:hypothetical protein
LAANLAVSSLRLKEKTMSISEIAPPRIGTGGARLIFGLMVMDLGVLFVPGGVETVARAP